MNVYRRMDKSKIIIYNKTMYLRLINLRKLVNKMKIKMNKNKNSFHKYKKNRLSKNLMTLPIKKIK